MAGKVKISATRIPDHAPDNGVVRLVTWLEDDESKSRTVYDILELGNSVNVNKTRKDLLQEIDRLLEEPGFVEISIQIISR